jgi:hypothetical protein
MMSLHRSRAGGRACQFEHQGHLASVSSGVQRGQFHILQRLRAFQNKQRLLGFPPPSELRPCALRSSRLRAQAQIAGAQRPTRRSNLAPRVSRALTRQFMLSSPKMPSWQVLERPELHPAKKIDGNSIVRSAANGCAQAKASPSGVKLATRRTMVRPAGSPSRLGASRLAVQATRR